MDDKIYRVKIQLPIPFGFGQAEYEINLKEGAIKDLKGIDFRTLEQKRAVHDLLFALIEFMKSKMDWRLIKVIKVENGKIVNETLPK